jgi:hypothetical protein
MKDENKSREIGAKLQPLINPHKHYEYNGNTIQLRNWMMSQEKDKTIIIILDKDRKIEVHEHDLEHFLKSLLPADKGRQLPVIVERNPEITELKNILMESIKQVKDNPDYVPQAITIAKGAQTMINLVNLQLKAARDE